MISAKENQECRETQVAGLPGPPSVSLVNSAPEGLAFSFENEVLATGQGP